MAKRVIIFETVVDGPEGGPAGPAGDGTFTVRRRREADMQAFIVGKTYYGSPATYHPREATPEQLRRWGLG